MTVAYAAARTSTRVTEGRRRTFQATTRTTIRSSASFQAATTSRADPRTPRSQSWAMATLCSASPATSATSASPAKRSDLDLINDRHQRETQVDDAHAAGEERCERPPGERIELRAELLPGCPVD